MTTKIADADGQNLYEFIDQRTNFSMIDPIVSSHHWDNLHADIQKYLIEQPLETWRIWLQKSGMLAMAWLAQKQECWEDPVLPFEEFVDKWFNNLVIEDKTVSLSEFTVITIGLSEILDQWVEEGMEPYM